MIYSSEKNPSPVVQILDEIYAINAKGRVHFFVAGEADIVSMKKALQVKGVPCREFVEKAL